MADTLLSTSISGGGTARYKRNIVFVSPLVGYVFYGQGFNVVYQKTTDGGATFGGEVTFKTAAVLHLAFDCWFDQWTPGDTTGTKIHCWYFEATNDKVYYNTLDTATDTIRTERTAFTGVSAAAGRGAFVSGTKSRSGYLYAAFDIDAGAEIGLVRSTDGGTNWSSNLSATFVEATLDECLLFPATGTGDDNDIWAIYQDASADALTMKMWDSSAGAQVESATMQTMIESATDGTGQGGFSGGVRLSDGHIIVASFLELDTVTSDLQVWDVGAVNAGNLTGITAKTNITTNIDDIYYPAVYVSPGSDHIFVAYNGKRDGSETLSTSTKSYYTKSTDGGTTWSAGDTAWMESGLTALVQIWAPVTGPRAEFLYRSGTTIRVNKPNSLVFYVLSADKGAFTHTGKDVTLTEGGGVTAYTMPAAVGSFSLTGQSANFGVKVPAAQGAFSLTGQAADLRRQLKLVAAQGAFALTGQTVRYNQKRSAAQGSFILTGQAAQFAIKMPAAQGTFTFTGRDVTLTKITVRILTADKGNFALTGQPIRVHQKRTAGQGSYALGGQPVTFRVTMPANVAPFTLTGQPAALRRDLRLTASQGAFTHTGQAIRVHQKRTASQGSYNLNGQAVILTHVQPRTLVASPVTFVLTGQAANLRWARLPLIAARGLFAETGQSVNLRSGYRVVSAQGSFVSKRSIGTVSSEPYLSAALGGFVLTGQSAAFSKGRLIPASVTTFTLNGQVAQFRYSRAMPLAKGSYALSGQGVTFNVTQPGQFNIVASGGSYILLGKEANFLRGRLIAIQQGSYNVTGQSIDIKRGWVLVSFGGLFVLTWPETQLTTTAEARLIPDKGFYVLTGRSVAFRRIRPPQPDVIVSSGGKTTVIPIGDVIETDLVEVAGGDMVLESSGSRNVLVTITR